AALGVRPSASRARVAGFGTAPQPRRSRCHGCGATHVLLAVFALLRRHDVVEVIGAALAAGAGGAGHRRIAAKLDQPEGPVRGWLRRFAARATEIRHLRRRVPARPRWAVGSPSPSDGTSAIPRPAP